MMEQTMMTLVMRLFVLFSLLAGSYLAMDDVVQDPFDVDAPLEYHHDLPILTIKVPQHLHRITLLEDADSSPIPIKVNLEAYFVARPYVSKGNAQGIAFTPDAIVFSPDGPRIQTFVVRARVGGDYSVGIRVDSPDPTAYREMQPHLAIEVLPRGRVTMAPPGFDAQYIGTMSRRYVLTLPPEGPEVDVIPFVGVPGDGPLHHGIRFEPPLLRFRGSVRSLPFVVHVSRDHDLTKAAPENVVEFFEMGDTQTGAEAQGDPVKAPQEITPRIAAAAYPIQLRVACPTEEEAEGAVRVSRGPGASRPVLCDPSVYRLPSLEMEVRAPVAVAVPLEVFVPLDDARDLTLTLSRPEDLVVVLRGSSPLVHFNVTEVKFSKKAGRTSAGIRVSVQGRAGKEAAPTNCSMASPCLFALSYYVRMHDDPVSGLRGSYLNNEAVRFLFLGASGQSLDPSIFAFETRTPGLADTVLKVTGKRLALRLPSNETSTFLNSTLELAVEVPRSAWALWARAFPLRSDQTVQECVLTVEVDATLSPSDHAKEEVGQQGEEEEDGVESVKPGSPGEDVFVEPRSLCFRPALDHSPLRKFSVRALRTGLLRMTYRLSGPASAFFPASAMESWHVAQVHYPLLDPRFDLTAELGLGGLHEEIRQVIRRAFLSRVLPASTVRAMGVAHVKGILLYGPPGCGKTSLARALGRMLGAAEPQVINGPDIISKYLGESEGKLRAIFDEAEARARDGDTRVQLIVFDEIDALFRSRGKGTGASDMVYDGVTNTLLSRMDGLAATPHVLVVGTTNRKELLDPALLRPGRMDVQIELGLPTEPDRQDILDVHLRRLRQTDRVASDVRTEVLAAWTESFSGAELEGLVKSATSHALERAVKNATDRFVAEALAGDASGPSNMDLPTSDAPPRAHSDSASSVGQVVSAHSVQVTLSDFERALLEVEPSHRDADHRLLSLCPSRLIRWSPGVDGTLNFLRAAIGRVRGLPDGYANLIYNSTTRTRKSNTSTSLPAPDRAVSVQLKRQILHLKKEGRWVQGDAAKSWSPVNKGEGVLKPGRVEGQILRVLVHGRGAVGKSALVAFAALEVGPLFDQVEVIQPTDASEANSVPPMDRLRKALETARKERFSLIVLDDLDGWCDFLEAVQPGGARHRFLSQYQVTQLRQILRQQPSSRNHRIIIATASTSFASAFPTLTETFDLVIEAPSITRRDHLHRILQEIGGVNHQPLIDAKSVHAMTRALEAELPMGLRRLTSILDVLYSARNTPRAADHSLELLGLAAIVPASDFESDEDGFKEDGGRGKVRSRGGRSLDPYDYLEMKTRHAAQRTRVVNGAGAGTESEEEEAQWSELNDLDLKDPRNSTKTLYRFW